MKTSYKKIYIIALCLGNIISLHAAQKNVQPAKKQIADLKGTAQKAPSQKNTPTDSKSLAQKAPMQKNNVAEQKAHPIIIHATRMLPKKTMYSLHILIQGLPAYSKSLSNQSVLNPTDLQNLQKNLTSFAKALGEKHPYLAEEKSQPALKADETTILTHIQIILKSLPWYIQNPKILGSTIDLHEFSKQLNKMHHQIKIEENKNIQAHIKAVSAQKLKKSKSSDRVQTESLANPQLSEDQQDMLEDSDGTPINETVTEFSHIENNDVISQSLSNKHTKLSEVTNKNGKILGSYQRTSMINENHIGKFNPIKGNPKFVIEGSATSSKAHGASKKIVGYVRNSSNSLKELTLYLYNNGSEKKHR